MTVQATRRIPHPSIDERRARAREAAGLKPPSIHAGWKPADGRPDPVALLEAQNLTREPVLMPSCAATPTCRISACSRPPKDDCCST